MKKITYFLKLPFSLLLKIIVATMMGLGSSMGKNIFEEERKNNKTIEAEK